VAEFINTVSSSGRIRISTTKTIKYPELALIEFAKQRGVTKVDVNEQNPSALNFYKAKGFRVISRDETDDAGRPYPILHLSL